MHSFTAGGPLSDWIETLPYQTPLAGVLVAACAVFVYLTMRAAGRPKALAVGTATLCVASGCLWFAVPFGAAPAVVAGAAGFAGLWFASRNNVSKPSEITASLVCVAASLATLQPISAALAMTTGMVLLTRGNPRASIAALGGSAALLAFRATFVATMQPMAALGSIGVAFAPFLHSPDLNANIPTAAWATGLAVILGSLPLLMRDTSRQAGVLALCAFAATTVGATESDYLHHRAAASLAPMAAVFLAACFDSLFVKLPGMAAPAAIFIVCAGHGTFALLNYSIARDTDRYIELSVAAAPKSATLLEARGQVLAARARDAALSHEDRIAMVQNAAEVLEKAGEQASGHRRFRILRSALELWMLAGKTTKVVEGLPRLSMVASDDPERGAAAVLRSRYLEQQQKFTEAISCLAAATQQFPGSSEVRRAWMRLGGAFYARQIGAESAPAASAPALLEIAKLRDAINADLQSTNPAARAAALVARGRLSLAAGAAVDATRDFNEAKRTDPASADAYIAAAQAYLSQGLVEGAARELRAGVTATKPTPPAELLVSLAAVELQRGSPPEAALQLVEMARAADPGAPQLQKTLAAARVHLAEKRIENGDLKGAGELLQMALSEDPASARAYATVGKLCDEQKRVDEAAEAWSRAFAMDPSDETREKYAAAVKSLALAKMLNRDREGAIALFEKVKQLRPKSVDTSLGSDMLAEEAKLQFEKGMLLAGKKDFKSAKTPLLRSVALLEYNFHALYQLGFIASAENDPEAAVDYYRKALEAAKARKLPLADLPVYYHLANELRLLSKLDAAADVLNEYLALGEGPDRARCEALLEIIDSIRK